MKSKATFPVFSKAAKAPKPKAVKALVALTGDAKAAQVFHDALVTKFKANPEVTDPNKATEFITTVLVAAAKLVS